MPLQKSTANINFAKGLDTKSDPYQIGMDTFLEMQNSVFTTAGRITKRNGFANVTNLPNAVQTTITTLNDNLIATGSNLYALSQDTNTWLNQGIVQPVQLQVLPLVRVSTSQTNPDSAVSSTGLTCLVYLDNNVAYYQVSDSVTGQQIVPRTALPSTSQSPRVFCLGNYFVITFLVTVSAATHLRYIALPVNNPSATSTAVDFSSTVPVVSGFTAGYDGYVANNNLYMGWANTSNSITTAYITSSLSPSGVQTVTGHTATRMSVTVDDSIPTSPIVWVSYYDNNTTNAYTISYNSNLTVQTTPVTQIITTTSISQLTTAASNGIMNAFYEVINDYAGGYPIGGVQTDYINTIQTTQAGVAGSTTTILRSVGLASKAFISASGTTYMFATYGELNHDQTVASPDQNTYFLIDATGAIYARLAYSNGGGYVTGQVLPSVSFVNNTYYVPYLITDFLATTNKTINSSLPLNTIYTQTGVNLGMFTLNSTNQYSSEIAGSLFLTGGQLWQYDGVRPVEQGFQVWPDNVAVTTATTGGSITAQQYFYSFTYEWTDNQGNLQRSAPSIPVSITTTGSTSTNTIYVPTLRLTYKISPNPVRIVGYRWSTFQPISYQFTSLTSPTINNPAVDFVTITDTLVDSAILGNVILYTTGGVVEDIAAPPSVHTCLFNDRLFLIDAEDPNLLWYSKQVIESTTVEMSDLLTIYVAPTLGAQGSTGNMTALAAMDDKLIIFKKDAIYYINGIGPDNTGANSTYSDPVYISSSVGCSNPDSIVLMPDGLMFQSDKGIWLLGRDLSSKYIGAPVEAYNSVTVQSAQTIPGTTQVRFILANNLTLMYDYFYSQWGTFTNQSAISATLWQGYQTYLNSFGQVFQEKPGTYLDGSTPVLISLTSSWISLAGIQGYERFYSVLLLGTWYTPFKLNVGLAYDFNSSLRQATIISPNNYANVYGGEANWGSGGPWGGSEGNVFTARIFPQTQKCSSFQVSIQEIYDPSYNMAAGQGLSLSGMALSVGVKRGTRTSSAGKSFG